MSSGTIEELEVRLKTILPEQYQDCYEDVQPVSMGSATLKYGSDGKVAWDDIWETFCDLAMAGGPPHKGALLEPGSQAAIDAQPDGYREVVGGDSSWRHHGQPSRGRAVADSGLGSSGVRELAVWRLGLSGRLSWRTSPLVAKGR